MNVEALRRAEFPITRGRIYFDHATFGPPPTRYVGAANDFLARMSAGGLPDLFALSQEGVDGVRAQAARLFNCGTDRVAFIRSTSQGVSLVAEGLRWREGDEVVVYEMDHPAGVVPWLNLHDRGVRVRIVPDRGRQAFDAGDVEALLGPRTRVVCLSLVISLCGNILPMDMWPLSQGSPLLLPPPTEPSPLRRRMHRPLSIA